MASIMTNAAAMTALQTLKQTNKLLDTTQGRISTGYRVAEASDNAAYWSIATTMRSDNSAMSTVRDALGLGAAQVDIAYTAMDSVKDTLDAIKSRLVAASQPDVDRGKIQEEINQLKNDLKTYAKSATFSGGNWLDIGEESTEKVVASFIRNSAGAISLGTIDVETAKTALFNSSATQYGLLERGADLAAVGGLADADGQGTDGPPATAAAVTPAYAALTLGAREAISFELTLNGGESQRITINRSTVDAALPAANGEIADAEDWALVMTQALRDAGVEVGATGDVTVDATTGAISTVAEGATASIDIANVKSTDNGNFFNVTDLDIVGVSTAQLDEYIQGIDKMFSAVTTAASDLGAIKTRIASQQTFVSKIMDAVDRGVGQLVDADMSEESTRLQALQVQQQLGIQALSIANGNAQNILALFN